MNGADWEWSAHGPGACGCVSGDHSWDCSSPSCYANASAELWTAGSARDCVSSSVYIWKSMPHFNHPLVSLLLASWLLEGSLHNLLKPNNNITPPLCQVFHFKTPCTERSEVLQSHCRHNVGREWWLTDVAGWFSSTKSHYSASINHTRNLSLVRPYAKCLCCVASLAKKLGRVSNLMASFSIQYNI